MFKLLKDLFCKEDDNKKQWDALNKEVGFSKLVESKQARDSALILAAVESLELIKTKHVLCDCMDTAAIADEALEKIYGAIPELRRRKPLEVAKMSKDYMDLHGKKCLVENAEALKLAKRLKALNQGEG